MRYKVQTFTVLASVLLTVSCENTVVESGPATLVAEIAVESGFIADGDTLVGDQVLFSSRVTAQEGGQEIPSSGTTYTSDDPSVIEILNASTGQALLKSVGSARVTVTLDEPELQNTADKLTAFIDVNVSDYVVELSLTSTVTGNPVDTTMALVSDTVRVDAVVRLKGTIVPSSGVRIAATSDANVADPDATVAEEEAALVGTGQARLTVTLDEPVTPGAGLLTDSINVNVESLVIELKVESVVAGSGADHLNVDGDTLVTDSVLFSGIVIEAGNDTTPISSATWTTTDAGVVRITDAAAGVATFDGVGTAWVQVTFDQPAVPINTDSIVVPVTTYVRTLDLQSLFTASATDSLVTDSVLVDVVVTKNGVPQVDSIATTESTDSSVIKIHDGLAGEIVFPDTGQDTLIVTLAEPTLPRAILVDSLPLRVTTYVASISGPGSTPIMGDTVDYDVTVTDTRGDTALTSYTAAFASSDTDVIRILAAGTGQAFARDIGTTTVSVAVTDPALPDPGATITDALAPTTITQERFYGQFSRLTGDLDTTVVAYGSEVHTFADSTEIRFPNGTSGFVDSVSANSDTLWFTVGAGTNTGQLNMIFLDHDQLGARDTVLSRSSFTGGGTVDESWEPNDSFPLPDTAAVNISSLLPFEALLGVNPTRTAPSDTNFFWLVTGNVLLDIRAETQQDANIQFFVCEGDNPAPAPPSGYSTFSCPRTKGDNDMGLDPRVEEELGVALTPDTWVIGFYCDSGCSVSDPVVTYKVTIREQ